MLFNELVIAQFDFVVNSRTSKNLWNENLKHQCYFQVLSRP